MASVCMPLQVQGGPTHFTERNSRAAKEALSSRAVLNMCSARILSCSSSLVSTHDRVPHKSVVGRDSRKSRAVRCEVAVELGGAPTSGSKVSVGSRIKVTTPVKVYHVPKVPEFNLEGCEGEVKDILGEWKGKPVSANLPVKVQFTTEVDGKQVNFFAHLQDSEIEAL